MPRPSGSLVHVPNYHHSGQARKIGDKFADRNILHVSFLRAWSENVNKGGREKRYSAAEKPGWSCCSVQGNSLLGWTCLRELGRKSRFFPIATSSS